MPRPVVLTGVSAFALLVALTGCAHERSPNIPPTAGIVAEGQGQLSYTASADGQVYVYNRNLDRIAYSGRLLRNQTVAFNGQRQVIQVDNQVVSEKNLSATDKYRIFFEPVTTVRYPTR